MRYVTEPQTDHRISQQLPIQIPPISTCIHPPKCQGRLCTSPRHNDLTYLRLLCSLLLDKSIQSKIYNISSLWLMLSSKATTLFSVSPALMKIKLLLPYSSLNLSISISRALLWPFSFFFSFKCRRGMSVICIAI